MPLHEKPSTLAHNSVFQGLNPFEGVRKGHAFVVASHLNSIASASRHTRHMHINFLGYPKSYDAIVFL